MPRDAANLEDVYSPSAYSPSDSGARLLAEWQLQVRLEYSPLSLARLYGLLGTLHVVPSNSHTAVRDGETIDVFLQFRPITNSMADRFRRKVDQLTEAISVSELSESRSCGR